MFDSLKNHRVTKILFFTALVLFLTAGVSIALSEKSIAQTLNVRQTTVSMKTNGGMASDMVPGEILIKFRKDTSALQIKSANKMLGAEDAGEVTNLRVHRVRLPKGMAIKDAIARYENMPGVEYAEPEYRYFMQQVPNDDYYADQWALPKIKAPQAWDVTTGGGVIVAVVDTGVDYSHEDLDGKVIKGYDYVNSDDDPMDDESHGTHVAGTIAGVTNNGIGIAGVSWGAKILAVKVLDENGSGTTFRVAQGIKYAADNGAKIINLSLGGYGSSLTMSDAIAYAQGKGCVIVAAAGNDNCDTPHYPSCYQKVIGVGATDSFDVKSGFSNYGWYVDVAAPGSSILSCYSINGGYAYGSGTSMATPHVAGLAALIASRYPGRTGDQLARSIMRAVDDLGAPGRDDTYGYGRINAEKAVSLPFISVEETGTSAVYSGSWNAGSSTYASGGTYRDSSSTGDSIAYTFNGTGITWVAHKHPAAGIARVYIDSVYQQDVDLYGSDDYQQLAYTKTGLSEASHTIEVEVAGTKNAASTGFEVNVDAFDIASSDTTAPATAITVNPVSANGNNGWYSSEPTITLTANETSTIYYRWAGGVDTTYTVPFHGIAGTHTLTVHAVDLAGNAEADHGQQFNVDIMPPDKPNPAVIALPNGNFKMTWGTPVDTDSAVDYYSVSVNATETTMSGTTYTFAPTPNTTYTVSVKAYDHAGNLSQTSTRTAFSKAAPATNAFTGNNITLALKPTGDTETPDIPQVTVSFTSVSSAGETSVSANLTTGVIPPSGYNILGKYYEIETAAAFTGAIIVTVPYIDTGLTPGQEAVLRLYHYEGGNWVDRTVSVDTANNLITAQTNALSPFAVCQQQAPPSGGGGGGGDSASQTDAPAAPTGFNAAVVDGAVHLSWRANTEDDLGGYEIYRSLSNDVAGAKRIVILFPGETEFTDTDISVGHTYSYWISAYDQDVNESAKTGPIQARISGGETPFTDIDSSHWAYSYILDLTQQGIIKGYADNTFRPAATITRAEFAKMICLAMGWELDSAVEASFSDVSGSSWMYEYVETARAHGSISGYPGGTFKPNKNVTRAEIAKIISQTLNLAPGSSGLNDISSSWARDSISSCVTAGIVGGYADNNFRPANTASRAEAAKMIVGVLAGK